MITEPARRRRLRAPLILLGAGVLSSALVAAAGSGTFSVFTAQVRSAGSGSSFGTLVLKVETATGSCTSTDGGTGNLATCTAVQEFGGPNDMVPGESKSTVVTVRNLGTLRSTALTLQGGPCTVSRVPSTTYPSSSTADDLCSKVTVSIVDAAGQSRRTSVAPSTLGTIDLPALGPGTAATYRFTTTMPDVGNEYQGAGFSVPLTWTLTGETAEQAATHR